MSKVFWESAPWRKQNLGLELIFSFCSKKPCPSFSFHWHEMVLCSYTKRDLRFCQAVAEWIKSLRESDFFSHGSCQGLTSPTYATAVPYVAPALKSRCTQWKYQTPQGMEAQALCGWNCNASMLPYYGWEVSIAAVRADRLSASGQPGAYPEGPRFLSDQNKKTATWPFQKLSHLLIIRLSCLFHFFLTCPCPDSRLEVIQCLASSKCVPTQGRLRLLFSQPGSIYTHLTLLLPHHLSSNTTSWGQGLLRPPNLKYYFSLLHQFPSHD